MNQIKLNKHIVYHSLILVMPILPGEYTLILASKIPSDRFLRTAVNNKELSKHGRKQATVRKSQQEQITESDLQRL